MTVHWEHPVAQVVEGLMTATVTSGTLRIAHVGCSLPATCLPSKKDSYELHATVETFLDHQYGSRKNWKTSLKSTSLLGRSLRCLTQVSGANGIHLVDTMRGGSDYWRPGKLLSDGVQEMRQGVIDGSPAPVSYGRFDELCPSLQLLERFRKHDSMSFGNYAAEYANELLGNGALEKALADCIVQNSRGWLPVFYCTDPYIKGYCPSTEALSPYTTRNWTPQLRQTGCHRVVLVEELTRRIIAQGFTVEVFELDQLSQAGLHRRVFSRGND